MLAILTGILIFLLGLLIVLTIANIAVFAVLHDLPWVRYFVLQHDVETFKDIPYVAGTEDKKQRLDLYRPKRKKKYPVVVFVHGGNWTTGDKDYFSSFTGLYANVGTALAKNGIGAVVINYRLAPTVPFEGMLGDICGAIRWTQRRIADYGGNPNAIFLLGHGSGAHAVALLAADKALLERADIEPKRLRGYVLLSAIYDLIDMARKNGAGFNNQVTRTVFGLSEQSLRRWSPFLRFRLGIPPLLMLTAEKDIPYITDQAKAMAARLTQLSARASIATVRGYTHADMMLKFGRGNDLILRKILIFVRDHS